VHIFSMTLTLLGFLVGLCAAYFWWRSSRVETNPGWVCEPGETLASVDGWLGAAMNAFAESARLNKIAALLTGISVLLSGLGSMSGAWRL
jgi:hypothetical protein